MEKEANGWNKGEIIFSNKSIKSCIRNIPYSPLKYIITVVTSLLRILYQILSCSAKWFIEKYLTIS